MVSQQDVAVLWLSVKESLACSSQFLKVRPPTSKERKVQWVQKADLSPFTDGKTEIQQL